MSGKQGGVIQLDGFEFAKFYGTLKVAWHECCLAHAVMSIYVDKTGKGLLSPMGASAIRSKIQKAMNGEITLPGKPWMDLSPSQTAFKSGYDIDSDNSKNKRYMRLFPQHWKMTGALYSNIVAIKRDGHWIVGINRSATVPKVGFRTYAKKRGSRKTIKVETYAAANEFGNKNMPQRPLFRRAALDFMTKEYPDLQDMMKRTFAKVSNSREAEKYQGRTGTKADIGSVVSSATLNAAAGVNPDADFHFDEQQAGDVAIAVKNGNLAIFTKKTGTEIKDETNKFIDALKIEGEETAAQKEIRRILAGGLCN